MWVDVWGAKVTRRYVPVIANVPPVMRRAVRELQSLCQATCELTVQPNNATLPSTRLQRLNLPEPPNLGDMFKLGKQKSVGQMFLSALLFPAVHETFMTVSKHGAIKSNLPAVTRQQREIDKDCCSESSEIQ